MRLLPRKLHAWLLLQSLFKRNSVNATAEDSLVAALRRSWRNGTLLTARKFAEESRLRNPATQAFSPD
jgi:hypothetical protein